MQTKDRDGISCDQCGITYRTDFLYYSFDFRPSMVVNNRRQSLDGILRSQVTFSIDVCPACFDIIKTKVVNNHATTMTSDVRKRGKGVSKIICELSGEQLSGASVNYYHCNVIKVDVKMSGQPNICVSCETRTTEENEPCSKCGGTNFLRPAKTISDDRFVEINVSEESFRDLVNKAENIRKTAGEWETKT